MLKAAAVTNIGKVRKLNQDFVYASAEPIGNLPNLFIVADGMGGHNAGDFASKLAASTMVERIAESEETEASSLLDLAVAYANAAVFHSAETSPDLEGMGTTIVACTLNNTKLSVANVGDSRLYVVRNHALRQITRDHSWVEEMVRRGGLDRETARNHPDKNIITRAVGVENTVQTDFFDVELQMSDKVLMCTDGLTNMLEDEEICAIVDGAGTLEEKADELIRRANANGGRDNVSVILISY